MATTATVTRRFTMPKEVSDRIERKAKAEKITLSGAFLRIVENYIDDEEDLLDDDEDLRLSQICDERMAERKAKGGRLIPLEEVMRRYNVLPRQKSPAKMQSPARRVYTSPRKNHK